VPLSTSATRRHPSILAHRWAHNPPISIVTTPPERVNHLVKSALHLHPYSKWSWREQNQMALNINHPFSRKYKSKHHYYPPWVTLPVDSFLLITLIKKNIHHDNRMQKVSLMLHMFAIFLVMWKFQGQYIQLMKKKNPCHSSRRYIRKGLEHRK